MIKKYFKRCCSEKSKFIHKYYLLREFKKQVTCDEIGVLYDVLLLGDRVAEEQKTILFEGIIIANQKNGWEKQVTAEMAVIIKKAVEAYRNDNMAKLSEAEIAAAIALNKRLVELEEKILKECTMLNSALTKRIKEGDEFLHDWEMAIKVAFLLDEDNPMFDDDDYNTEVMAELDERIHFSEDGVAGGGVCSSDNWNDMDLGHSLGKDRHCWLFHRLYDDTPVPINHFIHIDDIWAEVKVRYQHFHSFSDELKKERIIL